MRVFVVIPDRYSVARFSRSVDKVFICGTEALLTHCLERLQNKRTMLFPTSDDYINYIVRHYEILKKHYAVALPDLSVVELFAEKPRAYKFVEAHGIPHPWCRYPQSMEELGMMADELEYPVVIKPAVMYDFHRKFGKKAFLCVDKSALLVKAKELSAADYPVNALIVQEFLSGGAKNLYSYGFFAVDGEVKSSIMVNRIRQNPMDFGNSSTFAVTVDIPEIEKWSRHIISLTNYTGMGEVEFMLDKGQYKFLEINTRAWKWHTISEGRGFSFIGDWLYWLNEGSLSNESVRQVQCAWVERLTDLAVILKGGFHGQLGFVEAIRSYRQHKVSAVWRLNDPLPALMYVLMSPILYLKRY